MTYLTEEEFEKHLQGMRQDPYLAIDTEGTLDHPFSKTWGLSTSALGVSEYFAFNHVVGKNLPQSWLPRLKEVIENHPCIIFHNAKHDIRSLRALDINVTGKFYDTMLMAHLINENQINYKLDYLSKLNGGEPKRVSELMDNIIKSFGWESVPVDLMRLYGANDAFITKELFFKLKGEFDLQGFDSPRENYPGTLWDDEQKFVRFLMKVEDNGVLIDQELASRELEKGLKIMADLENQLGFNPGSPKQLGEFLIDQLGLPVVKTSKRTEKPSFDKKAMEVYDELLQRTNDKRAEMVLTYRGWAKTTSSNYKSYLELLGPDGRLRPNFKMHGTVTGRLSCEKPNLQQIPRTSSKPWNGHLKDAFIVEQGRTAFDLDFAQLELRLGAAYGKVQRLIDIFEDPERDIFNEMSEDLKMSRTDTKTLNYTVQYGGGIERLSEVFGVSRLAAKAIRDGYYKRYSGLETVSRLAQGRCLSDGFVKYWTGRRRHFQYPSSQAHKAFNAVIQGGAFEIVERASVRLDEEGLNNDECRIDLQVHDSLRFDIEEGKEHIYLPEIKRVMEDVQPNFGVKFKVDIKKWGT